jgi:hypothetical protein
MSYDVIVEQVPKFVRRYGDYVIEGSNNTLVVLGTDRAKFGQASIDDGLGSINSSGEGEKTGTIHIVAGRADENPDFSADKSFVYVTMKSDVDDNLDISSVEESNNGAAAVVLKSDFVRIISRKNTKVCVNDDDEHYVFLSGEKFVVNFGSNSVEFDGDKLNVHFGQTNVTLKDSDTTIDSPHFKLSGGAANDWKELFNTLIFLISNHGHMTSMGPSLPAGLGPSSIEASSLSSPSPGSHPLTTAQWPTAIAKLVELGQKCFA